MRWLAHTFLGLLCSACSTVALAPSPALPIGEFYDQVLDPLAAKLADERIAQAKADISAKRISPLVASLIGSLVAPGSGPIIGNGLAALNNSSIDQQTAALDARRLPLKKELLALFIQRAKTQGENYAVCVEGAERLYGVQEKKFVRLADGPGPCDIVNVKVEE